MIEEELRKEIERLKSENARLEDKNRQLAYAPSLMLLYLDKMSERFVRQEGRVGPRDPQVYEQGIGMERAWKELRETFAPFESLSNLLAPTIEVLRQATLRPITWQDDVKKELYRLSTLIKT